MVLQDLLQHWEELEQCIPVATQERPFGTPASMPSELTAPVVICTLSAAASVRAAEDELALSMSKMASSAAVICMLLMLGIAPAPKNGHMRPWIARVNLRCQKYQTCDKSDCLRDTA